MAQQQQQQRAINMHSSSRSSFLLLPVLLLLQSTSCTSASSSYTSSSSSSSSKAVTPGFTYNGDAECSYPFSNFQITTLRCSGSSGTYVEGYNDYDAQESSTFDESVCNFGDTISIAGTTTLDGTAPKQFQVSMKVCYGGSDWPTYDPQTCKTSRTKLDLTDYAMLRDAEYYDEEVDESEYYMQVGTYQWRAGFAFPKKNFYFANGSRVRVYLTFYPVESYRDYPYYNKYAEAMGYNANIVDSRYQTMCYASFDAVYVEQNGYQKYYYRAATGIMMFGIATYLTMKRKVICACDRDTADDNEDHYKAAEDDSRSIEDGSESVLTQGESIFTK